MKNSNYFLILLVSLMINNCKDSFQDEKFTLIKRPYNGNELKIDGYYYKYRNENLVSVYIFYSNGISFTTGWDYNKAKFEEMINSGTLASNSNIYNWGLFIIEDKTVEVEHYFTKDDLNSRVYIKSGMILNDTTIHFTKYMRSNGTEVEAINDTFHFKQFSPKPDSTNRFIK